MAEQRITRRTLSDGSLEHLDAFNKRRAKKLGAFSGDAPARTEAAPAGSERLTRDIAGGESPADFSKRRAKKLGVFTGDPAPSRGPASEKSPSALTPFTGDPTPSRGPAPEGQMKPEEGQSALDEAFLTAAADTGAPVNIEPAMSEERAGVADEVSGLLSKFSTLERPEEFSAAARYDALREEFDMETFEEEASFWEDQIAERTAFLRESAEEERGKAVAQGLIGARVAQLSDDEKREIEFLQRQADSANRRLNTRRALITETIGLEAGDFDRASKRVSDEFNRNVQAINAFATISGIQRAQENQARSFEERQRTIDTANFQTITNLLKSSGKTLAEASPATQREARELATRLGLPEDVLSLIEQQDDKKLQWNGVRETPSGGKFWDGIFIGDDGKPELVTRRIQAGKSPVTIEDYGEVTQDYGASTPVQLPDGGTNEGDFRRLADGSFGTPGVDFSAELNSKILSSVAGEVVDAGEYLDEGDMQGLGNKVAVKDEDGNIHFFSHLNNIQARVGQKISARDQIGLSGNTGNSTGPHLDYRVLSADGQWIDPKQFIQTGSEWELTATEEVFIRSLISENLGTRAAKDPATIQTYREAFIENDRDRDALEDLVRRSGQSERFAGSIRDAAETISFSLSQNAKNTLFDSIDRRLGEDNMEGAREALKAAARSSESATTRAKVMGEERLLELVGEIRDDLKEYEELGFDTGILKGSAEAVANKIGRTTDRRAAQIATKIQKTIQSYRKAVSGAAFTIPEAEEYKDIFPSISKTGELNSAKLDALEDVIGGDVRFFYESKFGRQAYQQVFEPETPAHTPRGVQLSDPVRSSATRLGLTDEDFIEPSSDRVSSRVTF